MEKRVCILMGSPREKGNTATLLKPMVNELTLNGLKVEYVKTNDFQIEGCLECLACQKSFEKPNCSIHDEMEQIFEAILKAHCLIIATPIFTWFCTPKLKAIIDRMFSCTKKYNESNKEVLLLKDKFVALVTTCGYKI